MNANQPPGPGGDHPRMAPISPAPPLPSGRMVAGMGLPFAAGLICSGIDLSILMNSWIPLLLGVFRGVLLRSWWSLAVAPLAIAVGVISFEAVRVRGLPDLTTPGYVAGVLLVAAFTLLPAILGAAVGVPLSRTVDAPYRPGQHPAGNGLRR